MSVASKKRTREKNQMIKRARKEANQVAFQARAAEGKNKKSKRFVLRNRRSKASNSKHQHAVSNCGNAGCNKCFPRYKKGPAKPAAKVKPWPRWGSCVLG